MAGAEKRVIVTGAASGIGAACVRAALDKGWRVCAVDINEPGLDDIPADALPRLIRAKADVTDSAACASAVDAAVRAFGGLDGLIHMAAMHSTGTWRDLDAGEMDRTLGSTSPALS